MTLYANTIVNLSGLADTYVDKVACHFGKGVGVAFAKDNVEPLVETLFNLVLANILAQVVGNEGVVNHNCYYFIIPIALQYYLN